MPARFRSKDATVRWHGTDSRTPAGHTLALGTDSLGTVYLWLFKGDQPTDEAFVGSIMIPDRPGVAPTAYDAGGGFAGSVYNEKETLAKLVERAAH
ncbi:hypothetical protein ACIGO8_07980 [Streptomyces sp. NPDC053493]|uniref:hypothetical protein n=1 Tax=Streptomyces sp. NPDC053493 TaxID=3365705 RepID=UPI0037CF4C72